MIQSKQNVIDLCDKLMKVNPSQMIIDLVQDDIEEVAHADEITPDDIGSLVYQCSVLREVYNPNLDEDINYLIELEFALSEWGKDAEFANKSLGLDPNQ